MIKVISNAHTMFAAIHLVQQLRKIGYPASIVDTFDLQDESLYIIYNAVGLRRMPKNYIVQQTEIWHSHFFNKCYFKTLQRARAVWDYSTENFKAYRAIKRTCIVTPGINPQPKAEKDIDYLFYGWIEGSVRRQTIINELKKTCNLTVVTNRVNGEMWDILKHTKTVINIHYYANSPLEVYRINEALSFGCNVLTEVGLINGLRYSTIRNSDRFFQIFERDLDNTEEIKHGLKIAGI